MKELKQQIIIANGWDGLEKIALLWNNVKGTDNRILKIDF